MKMKRKLYTGIKPIGGKAIKSRRAARKATSKYHNIRNEIAKDENDETIVETEKTKIQKKLLTDLDAMGGVNTYQQASVVSTLYFNTSKWIKRVLHQLIKDQKVQSTNAKPKVLEVGSININLKNTKWLDVQAIDLNSQNPLIEECKYY